MEQVEALVLKPSDSYQLSRITAELAQIEQEEKLRMRKYANDLEETLLHLTQKSFPKAPIQGSTVKLLQFLSSTPEDLMQNNDDSKSAEQTPPFDELVIRAEKHILAEKNRELAIFKHRNFMLNQDKDYLQKKIAVQQSQAKPSAVENQTPVTSFSAASISRR